MPVKVRACNSRMGEVVADPGLSADTDSSDDSEVHAVVAGPSGDQLPTALRPSLVSAGPDHSIFQEAVPCRPLSSFYDVDEADDETVLLSGSDNNAGSGFDLSSDEIVVLSDSDGDDWVPGSIPSSDTQPVLSGGSGSGPSLDLSDTGYRVVDNIIGDSSGGESMVAEASMSDVVSEAVPSSGSPTDRAGSSSERGNSRNDTDVSDDNVNQSNGESDLSELDVLSTPSVAVAVSSSPDDSLENGGGSEAENLEVEIADPDVAV